MAAEEKNGFTLIELVIVIIIVGLLAAVGISQYSLTVEKGRTAEAKLRIGIMRQLAYQYYLENGSLDGIQEAHVGVESTSCSSGNFYAYFVVQPVSTRVDLVAQRCTSDGKAPNASRGYRYMLMYGPGVGLDNWYCWYTDNNSSCFGLPPFDFW